MFPVQLSVPVLSVPSAHCGQLQRQLRPYDMSVERPLAHASATDGTRES